MFHKRQNVDAAVAFYVELLALEKLEKNHIKVWQQGGIKSAAVPLTSKSR